MYIISNNSTKSEYYYDIWVATIDTSNGKMSVAEKITTIADESLPLHGKNGM